MEMLNYITGNLLQTCFVLGLGAMAVHGVFDKPTNRVQKRVKVGAAIAFNLCLFVFVVTFVVWLWT